MAVKISLEELIKSGAHFGHRSGRWNPKMKDDIHGVNDGVHIFDLIKTKEALEVALEFLSKAGKEEKKIVFVGTKKQAREKTVEVARATESYFVSERWLGGTLTNHGQILKSIRKLEEMKKKREDGEYKTFTKKERVLIDREIDRLERFFGGMSGLEEKPDILVIVDVKREIGAAKEARAEGVETVGIVDSNSDPDSVDYAIPMNDDATKAISYVLDLMKESILEGKKKIKVKKVVKEDEK